MPFPQKNVILGLDMVSFGAFWLAFLLQFSYLFYTQNDIICNSIISKHNPL